VFAASENAKRISSTREDRFSRPDYLRRPGERRPQGLDFVLYKSSARRRLEVALVASHKSQILTVAGETGYRMVRDF
jgi:hypothetical protein